ncbi:MAG: FIST C-terminal domain-containing protein [Oscillospiraceae bacterium]|nr:FIST C-terminal domain-containing protein [Oscillospiraceae bacterium]
MVESYVININELDVPEDAVEFVLERLSEIQLKKNTFGIVTSHPDAIYSGVYKAVSDALPFPTAGVTCYEQCSCSEVSSDMFVIMLLTGDDVEFTVGKTGFVPQGQYADVDDEAVKQCYLELESQLKAKNPGEEAKLCLIYTPFQAGCAPCEYVEVISSVAPKLPVFGAVSVSTADAETRNGALTLFEGETSGDGVVLVLVSGKIEPQFFASHFSEEKLILKDIGVITSAEKNLILEIDGRNAVEFLAELGYSKPPGDFMEQSYGLLTTAFILDCGGTAYGESADRLISRAPLAFMDEGVICAGHVPQGARLSIANSTPETVSESAREVTDRINRTGVKTVLMYSCIGRKVGLISSPTNELELLGAELSGKNHVVAYAAGEFCPAVIIGGKVNNYARNQTLVACCF